MAVRPFSLDNKLTTTANHSSAPSNAVTFPAQSIIVASLYTQNGGGVVTTVSSVANTSGLTWTRIGTGSLHSGNQLRSEMYWAYTGTTALQSQTVTFTLAAATSDNSIVVLDALYGLNTTTPFVQNAAANATATSVTATLGAFATTNNATYAMAGVFASASDDPSPGSGFSAVTSANFSGQFMLLTEFKMTNDTSVDMTDAASVSWTMVAVEVNYAEPPAGPSPTGAVGGSTTDATSHTTPSFWVDAGKEYFVGWYNRVGSGTANRPTITVSDGSVVTQMTSQLWSGNNLFRTSSDRFVAATSAFVTVTGDYAGQTGVSGGWLVDEWNGIDLAQSFSNVKAATSPFTATPTVTLDTTPLATSWTWGVITTNTGTVAPAAGHTELSETPFIEAGATLASLYKLNSVSVAWDTANTVWSANAVEVRAYVPPPRVLVSTAAVQRAASW